MEVKSFWAHTHPLIKQAEEMCSLLIPQKGEANTTHGELLRCAVNIQYDHFNNGDCNAVSVEREDDCCDCSYCSGSGEELVGYDGADEPIYESCSECSGTGEIVEEIEGDVYLDGEYANHMETLETCGIDEIEAAAGKVKEIMLSRQCDFNNKEFEAYNALIAATVRNAYAIEKGVELKV